MTGSESNAESGREDHHEDERPLWASILLGVADALVISLAIVTAPTVLSQLGGVLLDLFFTDLSHFPLSRVRWDYYTVGIVGGWRLWSLAHRLTPTREQGGDPVEY